MDTRRVTVAVAAGWAAVLFGGAIFGFFYAWVCSTMWGLDAADPRVAIAAMQAMNASVRNATFFPAFFLTPFVMALAALLAQRERRTTMATLMLAAAVVYAVGGLLLPMLVNIPMNEALAALAVPTSRAEAETLWADYSPRWQVFNQVRTGASGLSLLLATAAVTFAGAPTQRRS
jgi:uncharacterized membrane protein